MMQAKKSLGQNFLRSGKAVASIVKAGKVSTGDVVLEIGPGRGALTDMLLKAGALVVAVEKDHELISFLSAKFEKEVLANKLVLIEGDILKLSATDIFKTSNILGDLDVGRLSPYKLIANIPYYITGEVIRKFLEEEHQPSHMVLLLQKEVAERIVARSAGRRSKESILSIAVKVYSTPRYVMTVKRECFQPEPSVDSAVVAFEDISKDFFTGNNISEKDFFTIVKTGFAHKRKKLGGNLKAWLKNRPAAKRPAFDSYKDKRAEELSLEDWKELLENQI